VKCDAFGEGSLRCDLPAFHDGPCVARGAVGSFEVTATFAGHSFPTKEVTVDPEPIMQFFAYEHLTSELAAVSRPFAELAHELVKTLPRNAERSAALRKLLEGKDAAVRAKLAKTS
jgi:hypothetical protein